MKLLQLLTLLILLSSCSIQKRANKAIKRIGAKPMLSSLVLNYPELFENKDSIIYATIHDTVNVIVNTIDHDTTLINQPCEALDYNDSKVSINYYNGHLSYVIKERKALHIIDKQVAVPHVCAPCPTMQVVEQVKKDLAPNKINHFYKSWFWLTILLLLGYFLKKMVDLARLAGFI